MPESIGSKKRVLPPGIVCDHCNNYFARKVEGPILNHPSMRNFRAWYQVPTKRGTYPWMHGHIGGTDIGVGLRLDKDGKLQIEPQKTRDKERVHREVERGFQTPFLFTMDMDPPKREMSRFVCKMALETVAETLSAEPGATEMIVDSQFFDNVREYARYGNNFVDWPYSQRRIFPPDTLMRHPETHEWTRVGFGCTWFMNKYRETLFCFGFYGFEFVINVGGPSIRGYEEWLVDHENISPIIERLGCYLTVEGVGQSQVHYLHGSFSNAKGIEFDSGTWVLSVTPRTVQESRNRRPLDETTTVFGPKICYKP
jgi:hypothetical protein